MNALIVEDDDNMAQVLTKWLEAMHFTVTVAASMSEAARIIAEMPKLEVITLDLNLPDSRASETIPRIKDIREQKPDALLVIVSGVLTSEDHKIAAALGADAAFEKHEVPTEKGFMQKLRDVMVGLVRTPTQYASRLPLLEALAKKVAERFNELDLPIGGGTKKDIDKRD